MRKQLDDEILTAKDAHFMPEYELGLISKSGNPYEFRLDKTKYPFEEIYKAASLSGKRGEKITRSQVKLLKSENRFVRYWAIVGLRSQKPEFLIPFQQEIKSALDDDYMPVSVYASAIAYENFECAKAENLLKEYSKSENLQIALMAINQLLYVSNKEPFIETIMAVQAMPGRTYTVKAACFDFLGILNLVKNDFDHQTNLNP